MVLRFNNNSNKELINNIRSIRKINKYTQKGIKISRSLFFIRNKKKK